MAEKQGSERVRRTPHVLPITLTSEIEKVEIFSKVLDFVRFCQVIVHNFSTPIHRGSPQSFSYTLRIRSLHIGRPSATKGFPRPVSYPCNPLHRFPSPTDYDLGQSPQSLANRLMIPAFLELATAKVLACLQKTVED